MGKLEHKALAHPGEQNPDGRSDKRCSYQEHRSSEYQIAAYPRGGGLEHEAYPGEGACLPRVCDKRKERDDCADRQNLG